MVKQPITRREFLGTTAIAGAGLLLASCSPDAGPKPNAAKTSPLSQLNIALIGFMGAGKSSVGRLVAD